MKVYISGRITGNPHYKEEFAKAELIVKAGNCEAVNPAKNILPATAGWADYMRVCVRQLSECDGIYMLANWQKSRGAKLEHHIAKELGLCIYYECN